MNNSPEDKTKQRNFEKYKELYYLSKDVFSEEIKRSTKLEDKAFKYLTALTFLFGAFAFFGNRIFDSILPPTAFLEWLIIIVSGLLLFCLTIAWNILFNAVQLLDLIKIPINLEFFDNNELITIYYKLSEGMKDNLNINRKQIDHKVQSLKRSRFFIRIVFILILALSILVTINKWSEAKITNFRERRTETMAESKDLSQQTNDAQGIPDPKPDENVKPPDFDVVTEPNREVQPPAFDIVQEDFHTGQTKKQNSITKKDS